MTHQVNLSASLNFYFVIMFQLTGFKCGILTAPDVQYGPVRSDRSTYVCASIVQSPKELSRDSKPAGVTVQSMGRAQEFPYCIVASMSLNLCTKDSGMT